MSPDKAVSASEKAFEKLEPSKHGPMPERVSPWRANGVPIQK